MTGNGIARACEASLARLGTDQLDLYLLHWPSRDPASPALWQHSKVYARREGFAPGACPTSRSTIWKPYSMFQRQPLRDQSVLYNIGSRSIEYDLLPWCEQRGMPVMAYTPLGGASLLHDPTLGRIGAAHGCSAAAVALAWAIRSCNVIAIPESGSAAPT